MKSSEIVDKIKRAYALYITDIEQYPMLYKQADSFEVFERRIRTFKRFFRNMTTLEYDSGGIRMEFIFDNGTYASVIRNKYSSYEWEIMSNALNTDEGIMAHIPNERIIPNLMLLSGEVTYGIPTSK